TWDEASQRYLGMISLDYVNEKCGQCFFDEPLQDQHLLEISNRHHGTLFPLLTHAIEVGFSIESERNHFLVRHYAGFLLFWLGSIFLYRLVLIRLKDWRWALLASLFFVIHPRIFAHSFFNPKDTIFVAAFIINLFYLVRFLKDTNFKNALLFALMCALLMNVRIIAIIVPPIMGLFFGLQWYNQRFSAAYFKKIWMPLMLWLIAFIGLTIAVNPVLWEHPLQEFLYTFSSMSKYNWDMKLMYWGQFISATKLPWHYIPSWFLITTPVLFTLLFFYGTYCVLRKVLQTRLQYGNDFNLLFDCLMLTFFFAPLLAVILKQSVMYDGWRHLYFLYVPFILIAIVGLKTLWVKAKAHYEEGKKNYLKGLCLFVTANIAFIIIHLAVYHPYQQTYFNFLVGDSIIRRFEMDYWGATYQQGIQKLIELEGNKEIIVKFSNDSGKMNMMFLPEEYYKHHNILIEGDILKADYYITNYRFKYDWNQYQLEAYPFDKELIYSMTFRGNPIMGIYKLKE
ncbi:MAG: hypothetical protein ACPG49_11090, partial [Chitinophagales bacterium]